MCLKEDSRNRRKERLFWENNGKLIKRRRNGVLYDRFFLSLVKEDGTVSSARLGLRCYKRRGSSNRWKKGVKHCQLDCVLSCRCLA